ncbi:MAG TPA: protein kinase [Candidatus Sulfotelmatobacter sp.]|nr:protein kinase [Candidatus Sulfotelmatobacter sp.]
MALPAGTKLGPYEIAAPLGAGGMGEVYRARDIRLDRSVAIKILPAHLADKPEAGERFEREARTISSLNHPNICQLHDVGSQDGVRYLVMELLEGETLAERLCRGPMQLEQVLRYGAEIARGLDAAHRCGVVHRDLKPGNIMLTKSGAKLMDFGLAKGMAASRPVSAELTATMTSSQPSPLTTQGTIVGTFQYMSPEQVEGKEADARSDIFSLGSVLYEMISGKRAFEGKTLVSVAAAILEKDPEPIKTLQPLTPPALERVIKKCLAKDPEQRWQNASDLASELGWIAEGGPSSGTRAVPVAGFRRKNGLFAWAVAAVALLAAIAMGIALFSSREAKPVVRLQINAPDKIQFSFVGDAGGPPVISPDGTHVVLSMKGSDGKSQLYLRSLDKLSFDPLPATEDGQFPFWSPDSRSIAFFTGGKLKRVDIAGGPVVTICDVAQARGGAWGSKGIILLARSFTSELYQVPATGGTPVAVTKLDVKFTTHRWPWFLPDGKHFLYLAANHTNPASPDTAIYFASLDGKENRRLVASYSNAIYVSGYLLYIHDNALVAHPFDDARGQFTGPEVVLNDDVQVDGSVWRGTFSASDNGTLIYQPGAAGSNLNLVWYERSGKRLGAISVPDAYKQLSISRDNKKLLVSVGEPLASLWVYDLAHSVRTRLTFANQNYSHPLWSPDGTQIAYTEGTGSANDAGSRIIIKSANGSGQEQQVLFLDPAKGLQQALSDWSPDGRYLIYRVGTSGVGNGYDLWILPLFGDRKPFAYVSGPGDQLYAQFSPDGKWVAYTSTETGRAEIYVMPFPQTGSKWQISTNGGAYPRWRGDGKAIFYLLPGSSTVTETEVNGGAQNLEVGESRKLFDAGNMSPNIASSQYAVTADGQRFIVITTGDEASLPVTVVQNWTSQLKSK